MQAGSATADITPAGPVWMDGMIRAERSRGVHDPLRARVLVLGETCDPASCWVIAAVEVCALRTAHSQRVREQAAARTGIPAAQIIAAATHTHSGPATYGYFNPDEPGYTAELLATLVALVAEAADNLQPARAGCGVGREDTISHYRRLLSDDGRVVMNWEPFPPEHIVGPLGEPDPEVGVLRAVPVDNPQATIGLLVNHAGHPNVMSGDNLLLSGDYPGEACRRLEAAWGGPALFVNGAQGSVDIDGLRHRDWAGMERAGAALARAASKAARDLTLGTPRLKGGSTAYTVPARIITEAEWAWAQQVLARTGGAVAPAPDGVGDDYKAVLYRKLREMSDEPVELEQTCLAVGDVAFLTFPGELFTEIGLQIKARSPFRHTFILGLANGDVGYVPTRRAIVQGGYAEDTRRLDDTAEERVLEQSLKLLHRVHAS